MAEPTSKTSPYVLGIDLGTTNTAVAVFIREAPRMLLIEGEKTIPSVLSVLKSGKIVVGKQAMGRRLIEPDATVSSIKRLIGHTWKKSFAEVPGRSFSPVDISSEIVYKAVTAGALDTSVDLEGEPKYAVICVPANFDDAQRKATLQAGTMAGLEILKLLEEPVAAAYAYAIEKERDQTIMVYDLGGGTFDASILRVDSRESDQKKFQVLAKQGIQALGGDDFDFLLMKMAEERFRATSGFNVLDAQKDQGASLRKIRVAHQKLRDAAITAKHELSELKSTRLNIPNLLHDRDGKAYHLDDFLVTRDQFNEAIRDLIEATRDSVEEALRQAGLKADQIDRVLLIGGSTKIPLVRDMLRDIVGQEPFADTDPDTAVARGAAILGATLRVPERAVKPPEAMVPSFVIDKQDIVTHHLGIEVAGGRFNCLIPKGTVIPRDKPVSASREYTTLLDGATELRIRVFQAPEEAEFVSAQGVRCTGEFTLHGIPARPGGEERIQVAFEIDSQNLLRVSATCSGSTGKLEISVASFTRS